MDGGAGGRTQDVAAHWWRRRRRIERSSRRKSRLVFGAGLAVLLAVVFAGSLNKAALDRLTFLVFDAYQRIEPRVQAGAPIVVVDIDEASIAALGQWPWPRSVLARMVDRMAEAGAATIAFDIVFPEADRTSLGAMARDLQASGARVELPLGGLADNDTILAEAFERAGNVTAGIAVSNETTARLAAPRSGLSFAGADPRAFLPPFTGGIQNIPRLQEAARGAGFFTFPPSRDGVVRVIPTILAAQGQIFPSLALEALRVAQGAGSLVVRSTGASGELDAGRPGVTAVRTGDLEVPTGPEGEFWVYFSGLPQMRTISASALLSEETGAEEALGATLGGHIVLVGTSAVGLRDLVATPIAAAMPGVRVHAEIVDQIVGQTFLQRPDWAPGAETLAALTFGVLFLLLQRRRGALVSSVALVSLLVLAAAVSWFAFARYRLLLDPILPSLAILAAFGATMPILLLLTDREKAFVRSAFARYLAPSLVERLAENPAALRLGGETREITVLFSDIRSFTTLSETLDPDALTLLLNGFLTPMTDILLRHEATIDKYIGDAIMAFWNAPLDISDHRRKACLAALAMQEGLAALNRETGSSLSIGIGLHAGPACVGNLGSSQRFSYSAIGDGVNLASRTEGLTKFYGVPIAVTQSVRDGAQGLAFVEIDRVRVVGRREPVVLHALLGDAAFARRASFGKLAEGHGAMLDAYRAGSVEAASALLLALQRHAPDALAKLYGLYAARLAALVADPPPPDWDGVFEAREK